ncbi:SDR family oxidoreductase [Mesorhizobium sp. ESP7-2]|uniref:UDP-glucuronic acid decarboxylase family protein n=1 Tax=Mesorhizobium sp. ESP7-2 TaxID=2876622 RepID=UPI001CCF6BFC|nr:UDP-glucuronic acid decarboxylase family protein [Mesorhizobium sp. ESP7-2]MBZ9711113.1 SDR family oxidoreductase [Mesorhizobium sp. ESP7-2]
MSIVFSSKNLKPMSTSKRRILIAGGAGFLGSHLCERLLIEGHTVICVDNFSTGRLENLRHLLGFEGFSFVRHDIVESLDLPVDEIYNLACPASPPHYQLDPIHTMKTSVIGSINLLELAVRNHARIFQASTSEVYGDPHVHPQPEAYWGNVNSFGPRACYDEGKRSAETLFYDFHKQHGLDIRVVRIFNTYGPRMRPDDGRVVSNFIVQALKGEDITVYGEGSQTRSFCYVDDLIEGFHRLMYSEPAIHTPVNIGNPGEFTVRELAERIIAMTGTKSKIVYHPLPVDDPRQRRPDISVAKKELGWEPTVALEDGLASTITYFERQLTKTSAKLVEAA